MIYRWERCGTNDGRFGIWENDFDFTCPVAFDRGRADYKIRTFRFCLNHRDYGLTGFAESHIIGEECTTATQQKSNTFYLMWIQPFSNFLSTREAGFMHAVFLLSILSINEPSPTMSSFVGGVCNPDTKSPYLSTSQRSPSLTAASRFNITAPGKLGAIPMPMAKMRPLPVAY